MEVTLIRLGRILAVVPAEAGKDFQEACQVDIKLVERPSFANGWTKTTTTDTRRLWWSDIDPISKQPAFCTMAGYEDRIREGLAAAGHTVRVETRVPSGLGTPDFSGLGDFKFRPHQKDMFVKLLTRQGGVFVACTGSGKTTLIRHVARVYPKSKLVMTVPSIDIARDMYDALTADIEIAHEVGLVGDGSRDARRITVAVTHSVQYCDPEANLVMIDEVHMCLTQRFMQLLNHFHRAKFFGFTASPDGKGDGSDGYLEPLCGKVLAESDYQEGVQVGAVCQIQVRLIRNQSGPNLVGEKRDDVRDKLAFVRNDGRNKLIAQVAKQMQAELGPDEQILIMVDKTEHAYRLQQLLPEFVVACSDIQPDRLEQLVRLKAFIPDKQSPCLSKDRARYKKEFAAGTLKYAIATGIWERGVDFRDLACLIRADGKASKHKAIQIPGRLSRKGQDGTKQLGILVDFNDVFSPDLAARCKRTAAIYRANGWQVDHVVPA